MNAIVATQTTPVASTAVLANHKQWDLKPSALQPTKSERFQIIVFDKEVTVTAQTSDSLTIQSLFAIFERRKGELDSLEWIKDNKAFFFQLQKDHSSIVAWMTTLIHNHGFETI